MFVWMPCLVDWLEGGFYTKSSYNDVNLEYVTKLKGVILVYDFIKKIVFWNLGWKGCMLCKNISMMKRLLVEVQCVVLVLAPQLVSVLCLRRGFLTPFF